MNIDSDQNIFSMKGKVALVTGASRGLGQSIAVGFARAGADVICCSSRQGGTDETAKLITEQGQKAYCLAADLSSLDEVRQLVEQAYVQVNNIDILVNNGGTIVRHPAIDFPLDEWQQVIDVNLNSVFLLSQLIGKKMLENKQGKIINIASMLSFQGGITVPAYTASKHGVVGITKALANEWAASNVQVNAIAPGYFRTDNTQALQDNPERNKDIENRIPAGKWGEPSQIVGAVTFLATQASDYVNGHVLAVDGGWLAR